MGFRQCHFFAGIGGWSEALRLAGIGADEGIWTGSCPCQAFSTAGKQKGFKDKRDLWPAFFNLIKICKPERVFGEQVGNAIKHGWLDRVYADLEGENYTVGAVILGAHSVGAPHQRQRLYWGAERVSDSNGQRCQRKSISDERKDKVHEAAGDSSIVRISDTPSRESGGLRNSQCAKGACGGNVLLGKLRGVCDNMADAGLFGQTERQEQAIRGVKRGEAGGVDDTESVGRRICDAANVGAAGGEVNTLADASNLSGLSPWSNFRFAYCRDNKIRRVPAESLLFGMADGISDNVDESRACSLSTVGGFPLCQKEDFGKGEISMLLKGIGNAIVPEVAAEFLKAWGNEINNNKENE